MDNETEAALKQIKQLFLYAADRNGGEYTTDAWKKLLTYDQNLVTQLLIQALWEQGATDKYWGTDVEGFCAMLIEPEFRPIAIACAPVLASILSLHYDDHDLDPGFILNVFEHLDVRAYPYLIPALIDLIRRDLHLDYNNDAWGLLQQYDETTLLPYQLMIDLLKPPHFPTQSSVTSWLSAPS